MSTNELTLQHFNDACLQRSCAFDNQCLAIAVLRDTFEIFLVDVIAKPDRVHR